MLDESGGEDSQYGDLDDDEMLLATAQNGNQSKNGIEGVDEDSHPALRNILPSQRRHSNVQNADRSFESSRKAHQEEAGNENIHNGKTHPAESAQPERYTLKTSKGYKLSDVNTLSDDVESRISPSNHVAEEVEDVPSDAFDSSPPAKEVRNIGIPQNGNSKTAQDFRPQFMGHRQTTLLGGVVSHTQQPASQPRRAWPMANRGEAPTHHSLDEDALKTWVYPRNLGVKRDYQFNIVQRGLFHNLLVALPTGLGKTFIAATVMLNWFRWTKTSQIVFVAPTKPLVAQQIQACFNIVGIPRSQTTMMTGNVPPGLRTQEWASKRVFFMTPQTFINDLKTGICDPKRVVLVVVDEAHRATGGYSYVEVIKFIRRFNSSFRVLALTATPGASIEQVQQVIDGLDISRVEIRTETDLDIRKFVHQRNIEIEIFEASEEMDLMKSLFSKVLQPSLDKLRTQNATWTKDPMLLSPFMLTTDRVKWSQSDAGRKANMGVKGMINAIFTVLASLAHAIVLLNFHGIGPFYQTLLSFRKAIEDRNGKGGKYAKQINDSNDFHELMSKAKSWMESPDFLGHPKLEYLQRVVLNHFIDAGDGRGAADGKPPSQTRIMIFVQFRDSADEVVRILKKHEPMIRPHVFVGQAASKNSEGMDQKKQLQVIADFKRGVYNTLVATSIGEEGLDIGEVDLIICYDASASPVRMLQRMGRTGRKRAGKIVLLLMRGKEEYQFARAKDNYEKMQLMIADGKRFQFHEDLSPRILPRTIQPELDERMIEIPIENTQADLPEPKKRGRIPKRPPKKFNMPDGVKTGFMKASRLGSRLDIESEEEDSLPVSQTAPQDRIRIPELDEVLLTASEDKQLERLYQNVGGDEGQTVPELRLDVFPARQRVLGRVERVPHGRYTKRVVKMLNAIHETDMAMVEDFEANYDSDDLKSVRAEEFVREQQITHVVSTVQQPKKKGPFKVSRSTHKLAPRISNTQLAMEVHSTKSDETDEEMDDFIVDDEDILGVPSSLASSPPSMKPRQKRRRLARQSSNQSTIQSSDSDDDIPDFNSIFRSRPPDAGKVSKINPRVSGNDPTGPVLSQKRGRRILEDSDDD